MLTEIKKLIDSELSDFFAGFGNPGEPQTVEEMQLQLQQRIDGIFNSQLASLPYWVGYDPGSEKGDQAVYMQLTDPVDNPDKISKDLVNDQFCTGHEAEVRGARDFYADYELSDNPYPVGTNLAARWKIGFSGAVEARARSSVKLTIRSHLNGHPIVFINKRWVYEEDLSPVSGYGGKDRPCIKCGKDNENVDACLGMLPGVSNACCGHGDPEQAYIIFDNGIAVRGFTCIEDSQD